MTRDKAVIVNQDYRQNKHLGMVGGNNKAARMVSSMLATKPVTLSERWDDALAVYGDYFIRY